MPQSLNSPIDANLLAEAGALNVNISRAAGEGIARAVSRPKAKRWLEENAKALEDWNQCVERHGLPLAGL